MYPGFPRIERADGVDRAWSSRTLEGRFDGTIIPLRLDREMLQHSVPSGLELDAAGCSGVHPVLLIAGRQQEVHPVVFGYRFHFPAGRQYQGIWLAIPNLFVSPRVSPQSPGHVIYFARIYLDRLNPVIYGRWPYRFCKCPASIQSQDNELSVRNRHGQQVLQVSVSSAAGRDRRTSARIGDVRNWLRQPIVFGRDGRFVTSQAHFVCASSQVESVRAVVRLGEGLLAGIRDETHTVLGADDQRAGAFRVKTCWTLAACYTPLSPPSDRLTQRKVA